MQDQEQERNKLVATCFAIAIVVYAAANFVVTEYVAYQTDFFPLLPGELRISIGEEAMRTYVYSPFAFSDWKQIGELRSAIPDVIRTATFMLWGLYAIGGLFIYSYWKKRQKMTSHGTAAFATKKDIEKAGLTEKDGFVVGKNPFNSNMMLHNGPEHILLTAPTRSGKGVSCIIPTGLVWKHSIFLFDPKGELWASTAHHRQHAFKQKVMKFEPLCKDGSAAKWNPFAEIDFQSFDELTDVSTISEMMVKTGGESKDPFWENSAAALVNGVILHLLYKHYQEKRLLPNPTDVMSFLSSPGQSTDKLFAGMKIYPHITKEDFLELPDENGKPRKNVLKEIYGEYVEDFRPFAEKLPNFKKMVEAREEQQKRYEQYLNNPSLEPVEVPKSNLELLRLAILEREQEKDEQGMAKTVSFLPPDITAATDKAGIDRTINEHDQLSPFYKLLVHPKVAESAANMYNGAEQTRASIMQTAQTATAIYQDPLIKQNMAVSDFSLRDLLDPNQEVSLYLVMQPNDIDKLRPVSRLFVNTMLSKLVRDMKFKEETDEKGNIIPQKKQRLLLLLDEFPQLGKLESIEKTLAICAGYGVKICIVTQSMSQLNKIYTKDNAIPSNCHVQIYFTPTVEDGGGTAKTLSDTMGDMTIHSISKSTNGKIDGGSTSTGQMGRKLMTPDEVRRMPQDKSIVLVAGHPPIYGDKIFYFKEKYFTSKVKDAPLFSDTCTEMKSYGQLFKIHALERADVEEKQREVAEARETVEGKEKKVTAIPPSPPTEQPTEKEKERPSLKPMTNEEQAALLQRIQAAAFGCDAGQFISVEEAAQGEGEGQTTSGEDERPQAGKDVETAQVAKGEASPTAAVDDDTAADPVERDFKRLHGKLFEKAKDLIVARKKWEESILLEYGKREEMKEVG